MEFYADRDQSIMLFNPLTVTTAIWHFERL